MAPYSEILPAGFILMLPLRSSRLRISSAGTRPGEVGNRGGEALRLDSKVANAHATVRILAGTLAVVLGLATAQAQEHKRKVPGLSKIMSGANQQAFSGRIQSLDLEHKVLNVDTVQGGVTETFPVKQGLEVVMADGNKRDLAALTPGTNVLVYYEQKGERRTVKQVVILASKANAEKKPPPPP